MRYVFVICSGIIIYCSLYFFLSQSNDQINTKFRSLQAISGAVNNQLLLWSFGAQDELPSYNDYDIKILNNTIYYHEKLSRPIQKQSNEPLSVHVVFHSHVDPGWLQTFEDYYKSQVHSIINNAVDYLTLHPDMRFIWSEMSFLERWWEDADKKQRQNLLALVKEGRFELTGAAWVMTDEATPYFFANIDNLIEGHQFVHQVFNVTPRTSWSVDPFGHGAMEPQLLSQAGIDAMVIGRFNVHMKEELRNQGLLLFDWVQPWDTTGKLTTPLVSALPKTYYTTSDACGMDNSVCCKFEYGPSARSSCGSRAIVTKETVAKYAEQLVNQYRTLQRFYKANVIIVAVGDDFYFSKTGDWADMHTNYKLLFDYINTHNMNTKVKFSTVSEYFDDVRGRKLDYPTLIGDFFPYTDNKHSNHPWWTGFYVQRPAYKRAERIMQRKVRSHDILSVITKSPFTGAIVQQGRRDFALCQHHDSITATSKKHVMDDYLFRLTNAFDNFTVAVEQLVSKKVVPNSDSVTLLRFPQNTENGLSSEQIIYFSANMTAHQLLIINQNVLDGKQQIQVRVNDPRISVSIDGSPVAAQVLPIIDYRYGTISNNTWYIVFYIDLAPLSWKAVTLEWQLVQPYSTIPSRIFTNNTIWEVASFNVRRQNSTRTFVISNELFAVDFEDGLIRVIRKSGDDVAQLAAVSFLEYGDYGGAYVFKPQPAPKIVSMPVFLPYYIVGPLVSRVVTSVSPEITQITTINNGKALAIHPIHIDLILNQTKMNTATFMTITTDLSHEETFYTDVNGLYHLKRGINRENPMEGNVYPVASSVFVQDDDYRLSVVTAQPTGATLINQTLAIMVNRRLTMDDGKGLSGGDASESPPTIVHYDLILERRSLQSKGQNRDANYLFHSSVAYFALQNLLYGPELRLTLPVKPKIPVGITWPCNIELINARYIDNHTGLILLRRLPFDSTLHKVNCVADDYKSLYEALKTLSNNARLIKTNLTGTSNFGNVSLEDIATLLQTSLYIVSLKFEL